tara:strand:+ start:231 stop:392 length:162 start_codon:yes stop_codon:yes gene_type:complete
MTFPMALLIVGAAITVFTIGINLPIPAAEKINIPKYQLVKKPQFLARFLLPSR